MTDVVPPTALSEIKLRLLCHDDIDSVKLLCGDWFPIEYPDSWYHDITSNRKFFSLAATFKEGIVGMIVAEIKSRTKVHKEDGDILASSFPVDTQVAYILSLGVVKEFRKHGIGSLLLDSLKEHISTTAQDHCKAIYLHVLTTNNTAIHFYENRDFKQHHYLPYYYSIRGVLKDGFTYVLYINGGHPPWTILYPFPHQLWRAFLLQPEPVLHPTAHLPAGPEPPAQPAALVRHLVQERHRVQPDHVTGSEGKAGGARRAELGMEYWQAAAVLACAEESALTSRQIADIALPSTPLPLAQERLQLGYSSARLQSYKKLQVTGQRRR
ncbi:hypothetical protein COCON_G00205730 [Conger conger]|uniref:N-alpha-acetyltransferase 60 n=1 Tax=Conger conger TaxID=82655 RepID=A0A9Q1CZL1_CONCO|nr:hypothetical protein COCON_G00205730 [Conger conger]